MGIITYSDKIHEAEGEFHQITEMYEYNEMRRVQELEDGDIDVQNEWIKTENAYQSYWHEIAELAKQKIGEATLEEEENEPEYVPYLRTVLKLATMWQMPQYANGIILKKINGDYAKQLAILKKRRPFDALYDFPRSVSIEGVKKYLEIKKEKSEGCVIL